MRANKLQIKYSVPTVITQMFMRSAKVRSDNDPTVSLCEFMYSFKASIQKPPDALIVRDQKSTRCIFFERYIEIRAYKYGFV